MSRIARNPINIPDAVKTAVDGDVLNISNGNKTVAVLLNPEIDVNIADGAIQVTAKNDSKFSRSLSGTVAANIKNAIFGVTTGFEKVLELKGVGYKAKIQGDTLELALGYSHPVKYQLADGVKAECPSQDTIILKGCEKEAVNQHAANIRAKRAPENYKGKGVRYKGEHIIIKETKKK